METKSFQKWVYKRSWGWASLSFNFEFGGKIHDNSANVTLKRNIWLKFLHVKHFYLLMSVRKKEKRIYSKQIYYKQNIFTSWRPERGWG